jgi:hypothetical protein
MIGSMIRLPIPKLLGIILRVRLGPKSESLSLQESKWFVMGE